ncbi:dihydrofolate reductase family protein [Orbus sturtevantii]|uniref:dihydrofolate reductase family protein n=1 Tax=Orbus sturtevantii TaxID=3074109 RepID=UPI00370D469B
MRKTTVFIAQSLDGYIATNNDEVDWLYDIEGKGDNGYQVFYDSIDTVIMGKRTYDWIVKNTETYPYNNKQSYIITHQQDSPTNDIHFLNKSLEQSLQTIKLQKGQGIWIVGGGQLISYLLKIGYIDEIKITVAPIILGTGIPLFQNISKQVNLHFEKVMTYGQFIELTYTTKRTVHSTLASR